MCTFPHRYTYARIFNYYACTQVILIILQKILYIATYVRCYLCLVSPVNAGRSILIFVDFHKTE